MFSSLFSRSVPVPVRRMQPAWRAGAGRLAAALLLALLPGLAASVDLNSAGAEQLQQIKGIGPRTAQLILEERQRGGPFDSLQDLADRVKGIGPKKLDTMQQSGLTVGSPKQEGGAPAARPAADMRKKP